MDADHRDDMMGSGDTMMDDDDRMGSGSAMMDDEGMMDDHGMMDRDADDDDVVMAAGRYEAYTPAVLANGETKVLFFHAAWCPYCRSADTALTEWYGAQPLPLSVYKVDYDTEKDLKARYGVTSQHTFILVDGQGNALRTVVGPSNDDLQTFLQS